VTEAAGVMESGAGSVDRGTSFTAKVCLVTRLLRPEAELGSAVLSWD
jgi:hypothetical protein